MVSADDGTVKTYTVTVTRQGAAPDLTSLRVLVPAAPAYGIPEPYYPGFPFYPNVLSYTVLVGSQAQYVTITATPRYANSTVSIGGVAGTSRDVSLLSGPNAIPIEVVGDGGLRKTYTMNVDKPLSGNFYLRTLTLSADTAGSVPLSRAFDGRSFNQAYTASIPYRITSIRVNATPEDVTSRVTIQGVDSTDRVVPLNAGSTLVSITVTAQAGYVNTYTVNVIRVKTAELRELTLTGGSPAVNVLSPAFAPATTNYTASATVNRLTIGDTVDGPEAYASLTVNGAAILSWQSGQTADVTLTMPVNDIQIKVTDPVVGGTPVTKTYRITATRPASTNANLSALSLGGVTLSPAFAAGTTSYSASVAGETGSINVSATAEDSAATVSINGAAGGSRTVSLATGSNTISVVVTAEDGTKKTYTATVVRPANVNLGSLQVDEGAVPLSPAFSAGTTSYTATVAQTALLIYLRATAQDSAAGITINGQVTAATYVGLYPGLNTVTVKVTAPDGVSSKTYTVAVTKPASANDNLSQLQTMLAPLTPAFDPAITAYTATASTDLPFEFVMAFPDDYTATTVVNGVVGCCGSVNPLQFGSNLFVVEVIAPSGSRKTYTVDVNLPEPPAAMFALADTTPPTVRAFLSTNGHPHHPNAWTNGDVNVHFTCTDKGGAGLDANACPADRLITTAGDQIVNSGQVCDKAGNCTPGIGVRVRIDRTAPSMTVPASLSATTAGSGAVQTYSVTGTDAESGLLRNVTCTPPSGSFFPAGTTTVTCTAFDLAGNRADASFAVVIEFAGAPRLIDVPGNITTEATTVVYAPPTASDGSAVTCSPASGSVFPIGTTTVTCTAGALSASFTVRVVDITAPAVQAHSTAAGWTNAAEVTVSFTCSSDSVTCPAAQRFTAEGEQIANSGAVCDASGNCTSVSLPVLIDRTPPVITAPAERRATTNGVGANVAFNSSAADALSGIARTFCEPASGSFFPLATTSVICYAADRAGNESARTFDVIVEVDTTPHLTDVPADLTVEAADDSGAVVSYTSPAAPQGAAVTCTPASGSVFPIGTTTVHCTSGSLTASFTVTVWQLGTPMLSGIPATIVSEATSAAGAVVNYDAPTANGATVSCAPASGATFPIGTTTVTCTATGTQGSATAGFIVIVLDSSAPLISGTPASRTVEAASAAGAVVSYASPSATDAVDGDVAVTCAPASGSTFPLGNTNVLCTSADAANNRATSSFNISVVDTTAPVVTPPADVIAQAPNFVVNYGAATAADALGVVGGVSCAPAPGSTFALGDTRVTCTARDAAGNTGSAAFTVSVRATNPPTLALPPAMTVEATSANGAAVTYETSAQDVLGAAVTATCRPASGSTFTLGATTVRCTATDARGNTGAGTFNVTVRDTTAPSITPPANMTVEANTPAGAIVTYTVNTSDAVDPRPVVICSRPSGAPFAFGATNVTCTARDANGNTRQAGFTVTVQDTIAPHVVCGSADGVWHGANVAIACTATDGGSGLAQTGDASFVLSTNVAAGEETANALTSSRNVCDRSGRCTTAGPIAGNKVDRKAPTVVVTLPAAGGIYILGQLTPVSFACSDGGSGVKSCTGTIASGAPLDTTTVGARSLTVNATDNVGNTFSQPIAYQVTYQICLLFDNQKPVNSGATLPIKLQLCNAAGGNMSSSSVMLTAVRVTKVSDQTTGEPIDPGNSNPDDNFRFTDGAYHYNLKTTGLATGTYALAFTVTGDPVEHSVTFQVR